MKLRAMLRSALTRLDFEDVRDRSSQYDAEILETIKEVAPFTMTSPARIAAACDAVRYVTSFGIEGSIVECGVWAGGSMMAMAKTLLNLGITDRDLYLFDTFEGMTEPSTADVDHAGNPASERYANTVAAGSKWAHTNLEQVVANLESTGYPVDRLHFVRGAVESTLPDTETGRIAILRLDTDWYESTAHELEHLAPRVTADGVLIIDDYGYWQGARKAVDEWIRERGRPVFLARTDDTGRTAILH